MKCGAFRLATSKQRREQSYADDAERPFLTSMLLQQRRMSAHETSMCQGQTPEGSVDVPTLSTPKRRVHTSADSRNEQIGLARFRRSRGFRGPRILLYALCTAVSEACGRKKATLLVLLQRALTPASA